MLHKNLIEVLGGSGLTKDGDAYVVPAGLGVTVYLSLGDETLVVDRVSRLEVGAELATVATTRKERYVVELDAVTAFRFQPEGAGPGY